MKVRENSKLLITIFFIFAGTLLNFSRIYAQTIHEKTFEVSPGQQIEIEADLGDVRIRTWDKNEVYVRITGNRKANDQIEFSFNQTDIGVEIKAEREGSGWFSWFKGFELKFDVTVPHKFDAYIYTAGGDIKLSDLTGEGELKTSGGDVSIETCEGNFSLKTSGGDVEIVRHNGDLDMATSGGDIKSRNHTGSANARTSGGDINLDVRNGKVFASTSGGDVILYYVGTNKGIDLKTSGGDIKIYADDEFSGEADLKTSGGDIRVDFPGTRTNLVSSSKFKGEINGGGAVIQCRTTGGDITLKRK